ncbi:MAG: hypothetical protein HYY30_05025 [Chloroflexi bacterium]|nr:hypothetical protein [Chloroflexota bacterium]
MAKELKHVDITHKLELLEVVEQVKSADEPLILSKGNEDVAIVRPIKRSAHRRVIKGRPTSADDPLWEIIGMAESEGPGDVSENVDKYLAEAYLPKEK